MLIREVISQEDPMPWQAEDIVAVRREMLDLLCQQVECLDSPGGLTDNQLLECYNRQGRVQQLREKLQALLGEEETCATPQQVSAMPLAA
jgi:hypothetical protein